MKGEKMKGEKVQKTKAQKELEEYQLTGKIFQGSKKEQEEEERFMDFSKIDDPKNIKRKPVKLNKENQIKLTEEIIETSYKLLTHKLAHGGLTARNENAFQLEFGHILKTIGQLYEFQLVDKFHLEFETYLPLSKESIKSKSDRARVIY